MNKERILELAKDFRENKMPEYKGHCTHFDMSDYLYVPNKLNEAGDLEPNICGTTCCIAGAAVLKYTSIEPSRLSSHLWASEAATILDLEWDTAQNLFIPCGSAIRANDPMWAARVLEKLAETGEVDWQGTKCSDD